MVTSLIPFSLHIRCFFLSLATRFLCQYHEPGSIAAFNSGMYMSNSAPIAVLSLDRTLDSPRTRTKEWYMNCSKKEVHALWQFGQPRLCRTSWGVISYSYPQAFQRSGIRVRLLRYSTSFLTTRFGSISWRRSKNSSIVRRWDAPRRESAHAGHPRPLRICAGVTFHSCPHFKHLNLAFSSAFTYLPISTTSSLWDCNSSTNSAWVFCLTLAHLGHPCPFNRLYGIGVHSQPQMSHFTAILDLFLSYVPSTVI